MDITGADYARDIPLTDHNGQARHLKDFAGKVVVVFFGFTQCPDVCPTSMQELAEVKKMLGKDGDRLQGIFVTVDPERDTPEVLKAYMANFDPSFLALYGSPEQLAAVAKDFKIYYKKVDGKTPTSYTWTTRRAATCMTRRGACASTTAMAVARRPWRQTSRRCWPRRAEVSAGPPVRLLV